MVALENYKGERGYRGKLRWQPEKDILEALNTSFYKSFKVIVNKYLFNYFQYKSEAFKQNLFREVPILAIKTKRRMVNVPRMFVFRYSLWATHNSLGCSLSSPFPLKTHGDLVCKLWCALGCFSYNVYLGKDDIRGGRVVNLYPLLIYLYYFCNQLIFLWLIPLLLKALTAVKSHIIKTMLKKYMFWLHCLFLRH